MSYNGYRNWETWAFMVHFGDYLFESLKEQKEYDKVDYQTVYNTVESLIDEMMDGIENVHIGSAFLSDLVSASLGKVDIQEIADLVFENLKED